MDWWNELENLKNEKNGVSAEDTDKNNDTKPDHIDHDKQLLCKRCKKNPYT